MPANQRHQTILPGDNLENRLLVQGAPEDGTDSRLMPSLTHLDTLTDGRHMIITAQEPGDSQNRILIQSTPSQGTYLQYRMLYPHGTPNREPGF